MTLLTGRQRWQESLADVPYATDNLEQGHGGSGPRTGLMANKFALVLIALIGTAQAAAVGQWAPLTGLSPAAKIRLQHLRESRCLPEAAELALPIYPHAVVIGIDWGRVKPPCNQRDGWRDLGGLTLASADNEAEVAAWYADHLDNFAQYVSARDLLFIQAHIADFLWERDYYKYPNIAIMRARGEWDAAGYRTIIELNRPAPH